MDMSYLIPALNTFDVVLMLHSIYIVPVFLSDAYCSIIFFQMSSYALAIILKMTNSANLAL